MSKKNDFLGGLEEFVLRAVLRLGETAYGVTIRKMVAEVTGQESSYGAIYAALERLEQKGMVTSRQGEATPQRGGRAKRYYNITGAGTQALNEADRIRMLLTGGVQTAGGVV